MGRRLLVTVGLVLLGAATLGAVFVLGMRTKNPLVVNTVRRVNRGFFNPQQLRTAGTPGAYAGVVVHRGRTSGKEYRTPVGIAATEDGFVIALVYGRASDWLRNVIAAGGATVVHEGRDHQVDRPEIVPFASAAADFPDSEIPAMRLIGVTECLRLRRVPDGA